MEEEIKKIMGEAYKENMTSTEIQDFFKKQVLSSGLYVNKEAAEAEKRKLSSDLEAKTLELQSRMTDDEKKVAADQALKEQIAELQKELLKGKISSSEAKALGITAKARINAGIEENDEEFSSFIKSIANEDETKTSKSANYINTLIEKAYQKGKTDATKNQLGQMGNLKSEAGQDELTIAEERAKRLAERTNSSQVKKTYFK